MYSLYFSRAELHAVAAWVIVHQQWFTVIHTIYLILLSLCINIISWSYYSVCHLYLHEMIQPANELKLKHTSNIVETNKIWRTVQQSRLPFSKRGLIISHISLVPSQSCMTNWLTNYFNSKRWQLVFGLHGTGSYSVGNHLQKRQTRHIFPQKNLGKEALRVTHIGTFQWQL